MAGGRTRAAACALALVLWRRSVPDAAPPAPAALLPHATRAGFVEPPRRSPTQRGAATGDRGRRRASRAAGASAVEATSNVRPGEAALTSLRKNLEALDLSWVALEGELAQVAESMVPQDVEEGEVVFHQGDEGLCFYIVEEGSFGIYVQAPGGNAPGEKMALVGPGGGFGERALLYKEGRAATVVAASAGRLWRMDGSDFLGMVARSAEIPENIMNSFRENRELGALFWMLRTEDFIEVCRSMTPVRVAAGEAVVLEGDVGTGFYVVDSGTLEVSVTEASGDTRTVDELGPGDSFGELALLYDRPRAATVTATSDSRLWVLSRTGFKAAAARASEKPVGKRTMDFLRRVPLFQGISEGELRKVCSMMRPLFLRNGQVLAKAREDVARIYVLQTGEVSSWAQIDYGERQLDRFVEPGEVLDKSSLWAETWPATLRAGSDVTVVLWISKLTLQKMFDGSMARLIRNVKEESTDWWPFR